MTSSFRTRRWFSALQLIPFLIFVIYGYIGFRDRFCVHNGLLGETRFLELSTAVLFGTAGLLSLGNAYTFYRKRQKIHWFFIAFGLVLLLVLMEEISWGQHLFQREASGIFFAENNQRETNLHNFLPQRYQFVYYIPLIVYGVAISAMANTTFVTTLREKQLLETLPYMGALVFAAACLVALKIVPYRDPGLRFAGIEVAEQVIATCLVFTMIYRRREMLYSVDGGNYRWAATSIGVLLILVIGTVLSVQSNCYFAEYRDLAHMIEQNITPDDAVVFIGEPRDTHIVLLNNARTLDNLYALPDEQTFDTIDEIYDSHSSVYIIYFQDWLFDSERSIEFDFMDDTYVLGDQWFGLIRVTQYMIGTQDIPHNEEALAQFGDHISLHNVVVDPDDTVGAGDLVGATIEWVTDEPLDVSYKVFFHIYGAEGIPLAQHDGVPGADLKPTHSWQPDQPIFDRHAAQLPPDLPPGTYAMAVGMYHPDTLERLPVELPDGTVTDKFDLPPLTVQ